MCVCINLILVHQLKSVKILYLNFIRQYWLRKWEVSAVAVIVSKVTNRNFMKFSHY